LEGIAAVRAGILRTDDVRKPLRPCGRRSTPGSSTPATKAQPAAETSL